VKASSYDAQTLVAAGFTVLATGALQEQQPISCDMNPWQESTDKLSEEQSVVTWLAGEGVAIDRVGFVEKAEPSFQCEACSCARGDRLVVAAPAAIDSLGFVDVYKP
jgi:hypothetical protein